jgi:hypothetical protein
MVVRIWLDERMEPTMKDRTQFPDINRLQTSREENGDLWCR